MLTAVLFWLFILAIAVQCGYALYFFTHVFHLPRQEPEREYATIPVTVLICARNEARNLERYLPAVLAQRYSNESGKPMYEVIVVNDASDDDTEQVLYRLEQEYAALWHVTIGRDESRTMPGKKFALSRGVHYATHPFILLTDADCMPSSEHWIRHMAAPLERGRAIVAGYGGYRSVPGFLNTFIRWETLHTFVQLSSYALAGKPYMAVGRNLACTKEVLLKAEQSEAWNELPSGDDDLLMRACATPDNTAIVAHRDAFTHSDPKAGWGAWLRQKQRHLSTGKYYRDDIKLLLGGYAISHALCWLLFLVLIYWIDWTLVLIIMAMRCAIYWTIWKSAAIRLQERRLLRWMPLTDFGWMVYNLVLSPYIIWKNKKQWK